MNELLHLDRRSLMERMLFLVGASAVGGFSTAALAKAASRKNPYFSEPVFTLLSAVADTIVPRTDTPGAVDAGVPATFDALIAHWASSEHRYQLASALTVIDRLAHEKHDTSFAKLPNEQRYALLKAHDAEALKVVPSSTPNSSRSFVSGPSYADPAYGKLKELLVVLYYLSEPALTHELVYEHAPGTWQPSIPVTPDTRPTGGAALF